MTYLDQFVDVKKDIEDIMTRYNVPMDDRMLVFEKINDSIEQKIDVAARMDQAETHQKIQSQMQDVSLKIQEAYREGLAQGASEARPSMLQNFIQLGLLLLAGYVILQGLFKKA